VTWRATGVASDTLAPGTTREVMVGATSVLLAHVGTTIFGLEATCPHIGGLLADGTLLGARLTCPDHGAIFDVTNGKVIADPFGVEPPEGAVDEVITYPTRVVNGLVEVDVP
jgi:nitrite reductase/ring-hydroxylating ferredoxin subunit